MQNQDISTDGVYIMGNFQEVAGFSQNWDAGITKLKDLNGDNTYEISLNIPEGNYEYLFVNGMGSSNAEILPLNCYSNYNREINVVTGNNSLETHCFNTCDECDTFLNNNFDTHWWNNTIFY